MEDFERPYKQVSRVKALALLPMMAIPPRVVAAEPPATVSVMSE